MSSNPSVLVLLLPKSARSSGGVAFNPTDERWMLTDATRRNVVLDWERIQTHVSVELLHSLKLTLLWYVENKSLSHASNIFSLLELFLRHVAHDRLANISSAQVLNFRAALTAATEWKLSVISGYLKKLTSLGLPGVEKEIPKLVGQMHLKGNPSGTAVLTMDPNEGPFTVIESLSISDAAARALPEGKIQYDDFALLILLQSLGARNVQYACLKLRDFTKVQLSDGGVKYELRLPRAKQMHSAHRAEFKVRVLAPDVGEVLEVQRARVLAAYKSQELIQIAEDELPLFPNWNCIELPGFLYHASSAALGDRIKDALSRLKIPSERTGGTLRCHARRFRSTVATRAAEEGYGLILIAELLDHSDLQSAGIYIDASSTIIENIDRAVAVKLAPLAQAFSGKLVRLGEHTTSPGDPRPRIRHPDFSGDLGGCGRLGFCSAAAPVACYTCKSFQAWDDAPHAEVLHFLLRERRRVQELTGDLKIASINDRTIFAVAQVIQLVAESRSE